MSMIRWKTLRLWSSKKPLLIMAAAALFLVSVNGKPSVGATARGGTLKSPVPPIQYAMTLKCLITSLAIATGDSKDIKTKLPPASGSLMFTVVDGQLAMVGAEGAQRFRLLSSNVNDGAMYFEELTGAGNVVLWAFHSLKDRCILFSGQLSVNNSGPTREQVLVMTQAGYCETTGGNGQPIRK
jgi:hypothetical protein